MKEGFSIGSAQGTSEIPLNLSSMRAYTGHIHPLVAGSYIPDPIKSIDFSVERLLALHIRRTLSRLRRWQKGSSSTAGALPAGPAHNTRRNGGLQGQDPSATAG